MTITAPVEAAAAQTAVPVETAVSVDTSAGEPVAVVEQDLLVEDVSIDGMCGVY